MEEDKVQAAIMPPAPGLVFIMMGSINASEGFRRIFHGDARLVVPLMRFPFFFEPLHTPALHCSSSSTVRNPRAVPLLVFFYFLRVEQTGVPVKAPCAK